jgi:hypothetical protein
MNLVKVIIYDNNGPCDTTKDSLHGCPVDLVEIENDPSIIDKEVMNGDHKIVVLTDNRNSFNSVDDFKTLVRLASNGCVASPVFVTNGCREPFHPSVLRITEKELTFKLSWNPSPPSGTEPYKTRCLMGCCQAFTKEWFSRTGGFMAVCEPDSRDILLSLKTNAMGGSCMVAPMSRVTRMFGGEPRGKKSEKEHLKIAFLCLSHNDLQEFVKRLITPEDIDKIVSREEIGEWMRMRIEHGVT